MKTVPSVLFTFWLHVRIVLYFPLYILSLCIEMGNHYVDHTSKSSILSIAHAGHTYTLPVCFKHKYLDQHTSEKSPDTFSTPLALASSSSHLFKHKLSASHISVQPVSSLGRTMCWYALAAIKPPFQLCTKIFYTISIVSFHSSNVTRPTFSDIR